MSYNMMLSIFETLITILQGLQVRFLKFDDCYLMALLMPLFQL